MLNLKELPRLDPRTKNTPPPSKENLPSVQQAFSLFLKRYCVLLFVPALIFYFIYCNRTEKTLQNGVYEVLREIGSNGFGVKYSKPKGSFFAFTGGIYIDDLVLIAPEKMGGATIKASRIELSANPLNPQNVLVQMHGAFSVTKKDGTEIRLQVQEMQARFFAQNSKKSPSLKITVENLISISGIHHFKLGFLSLETSQRSVEMNGQMSFDYVLDVNQLRLADEWRPLPELAEFVRLEGIVQGISSRRDKPLIDDWLKNSGTLEIKKGEIVWQPLMSEFSATFGINPSFQSIVAASAKVYGFFNFLDILERMNVVRSADVSVAKIVLGQRLKVEDGETRLSLTSPFTWQFGKFYAGPVLLFDSGAEASAL